MSSSAAHDALVLKGPFGDDPLTRNAIRVAGDVFQSRERRARRCIAISHDRAMNRSNRFIKRVVGGTWREPL
jgi:hypothetical protein